MTAGEDAGDRTRRALLTGGTASDKAGYLNATTVTVDGGLSQSSVGL